MVENSQKNGFRIRESPGWKNYNFTIHDAIKILSKLSVSESESTVFSGVWNVWGLLLFVLAATATPERSFSAPKRVKTYLRTNRAYEREKMYITSRPGRMKICTLFFSFVCQNNNLFLNLSMVVIFYI